MKDTEYTFAVARIRSNENKLLNAQDYASVISAPSYEEAARRLSDKGYEINGVDYSGALDKRLDECWELISSVLPDPSQFDSILIKNDFANLKVAEKAFILDKSTDGLFERPSVYDPEEIKEYVFNRKNSSLPFPLQHADRSSHRILSKTRFAQLSDSVIDRASMEWSIKLAAKADHPVLLEIAEAEAALASIKVLYRCILTEKEPSFMERAVCACSYYDKERIIKAADKGMNAFLEYLSHTSLAGAGKALKESPTAFEKWSDDKITDILKCAKTEYFSIAPLAAYYYAATTEIRNVRIILSAKQGGLAEDIIRARVRESYV